MTTLGLGAAAGVGLGVRKAIGHETAVRKALFTDALMNPELARLYLSKVPADGKGGPMRSISAAIRRELIAGPLVVRASQQKQREGYARGGAISRMPSRADPRQIDAAVASLMASAARAKRELGMATAAAVGMYA